MHDELSASRWTTNPFDRAPRSVVNPFSHEIRAVSDGAMPRRLRGSGRKTPVAVRTEDIVFRASVETSRSSRDIPQLLRKVRITLPRTSADPLAAVATAVGIHPVAPGATFSTRETSVAKVHALLMWYVYVLLNDCFIADLPMVPSLWPRQTRVLTIHRVSQSLLRAEESKRKRATQESIHRTRWQNKQILEDQ
jgi:hypothetical protein